MILTFLTLIMHCSKKNKFKAKILPTAATMRDEVVRRSKITDRNKVARPAGWTKKKCVEYLKTHHTFLPEDISFLIKKERELHMLIENAEKEKREQEHEKKVAENWVGELPYLRLYACVVHDSVKPSYL